MKNSGPMEQRELIRELYGLYADASCRGAKDDWLACWASDGRWTSHLFDCTGQAELAAQWDALWATFAGLAFFTQIGPIAVTGETAKARSYAREVIRMTGGGMYKLAGAYEDTLRVENGEWRFARRDYRVLVEELPE